MKKGVNMRKMRAYGMPSATMPASPPISRRRLPGAKMPTSKNGTLSAQAQKMALEKYFWHRASPWALRMA